MFSINLPAELRESFNATEAPMFGIFFDVGPKMSPITFFFAFLWFPNIVFCRQKMSFANSGKKSRTEGMRKIPFSFLK